jgi:hypothetical protein
MLISGWDRNYVATIAKYNSKRDRLPEANLSNDKTRNLGNVDFSLAVSLENLT